MSTQTYQDAVGASYAAPVMILFTATWCGPCKTVKPMIERLAQEKDFPLFKLDADENRDLLTSLGVRGVPAVVVLREGDIQGQAAVGAKTEAQYRQIAQDTGLGW